MSDAPHLTRSKQAARIAREARVAQALRDNLRRRKQQARVREAAASEKSDDGNGAGGAPAA